MHNIGFQPTERQGTQRCHIHPSAPHRIAKNEDVLSFALPLLSRDTSRQRHNAVVTPRGTAVQRAKEKSRRARSQGRCAVPAGVGGVAQVVQSNAAPSNVWNSVPCPGGVTHCVPSNAAPLNVWNAAPSPGCGQPTRQGGGVVVAVGGETSIRRRSA